MLGDETPTKTPAAQRHEFAESVTPELGAARQTGAAVPCLPKADRLGALP